MCTLDTQLGVWIPESGVSACQLYGMHELDLAIASTSPVELFLL